MYVVSRRRGGQRRACLREDTVTRMRTHENINTLERLRHHPIPLTCVCPPTPLACARAQLYLGFVLAQEERVILSMTLLGQGGLVPLGLVMTVSPEDVGRWWLEDGAVHDEGQKSPERV